MEEGGKEGRRREGGGRGGGLEDNAILVSYTNSS